MNINLIAPNTTISCRGLAEFGKIEILNLEITSSKISLTYTDESSYPIVQKFITTEYMVRNGTTASGRSAYFIGGTKSGAKNDYNDIALPHLGLEKNILTSDLAFNHNGRRVFGTVKCWK